MPRRAEGQIIVFKGKRGTIFRARYRDAGGKRVCETLYGVTTHREAEKRLAEILVDVRREGRRKLEPVTFATFAREWLATYPDSKELKYSMVEGYEGTIEKHLIPALGAKRLDSIDVAAIERYVAVKQKEVRADGSVGYAARTLHHHLNLLHLLFKAAERRPHVDHERRGGGAVAWSAHGARRSLGSRDDAALHRPGRRGLPRGGRAARRSRVRARGAQLPAQLARSTLIRTTERPLGSGPLTSGSPAKRSVSEGRCG
jgi:hypothetical protein